MSAVPRGLATLGPAGFFPIAPATFASALVTLAGWFLPVPPLFATAILLILGTALAIWSAGIAERTLGHDAKPIVIDEVIGQSCALLWVPHVAWMFAAAFVLFRIFDVWKPLGAHQAQRLPGGFGVVADDVIAGFTACGAFHLAAWGFSLVTAAHH